MMAVLRSVWTRCWWDNSHSFSFKQFQFPLQLHMSAPPLFFFFTFLVLLSWTVRLKTFYLSSCRSVGRDRAGWRGSQHPVPADEEAVELAVHWKHSEDHQTAVWDPSQQVTFSTCPTFSPHKRAQVSGLMKQRSWVLSEVVWSAVTVWAFLV